MRYFDSVLTSDASGLQLNLEIALSGVSAKVNPFRRFSGRWKVRRDVGLRNQKLCTRSAESRQVRFARDQAI
jgi:hypothetical protein